MIQSVYLIVIPGADRVYVSGTYPESYVATQKGSRVFRADVELQGLDKVDGLLKLTAAEVTLGPPK